MALQHLNEGETIYVQGSARDPYKIRKIAGVVDCSCPAWRNLGQGIDTRVCKHIRLNIKPECLPHAALVRSGMISASTSSTVSTPATPVAAPVRLTPKGKVSTAVGGAVRKATAPDLLLAETWTDQDPTGMWISEKLDGVRAYWDGENFISRLGNIFVAPESFKRNLPKSVNLDGELWLARGKFQETLSTVRKFEPNEAEWAMLTYVVFDAPQITLPFEARMVYLQNLKALPAHASRREWRVLEQVRCQCLEHMTWMLADVEAIKGEGLMLREYGSLYIPGRNSTLLKVKTFTDAEAVVVGYMPGRGKHKGRMGACIVQMPNGKDFEVGGGFTDKQRISPPAIGAKITYKHQGFTNRGIPRIATFVCCRDYE